MKKSKILLLGKLPPPFIGPTIATDIILNSKLREEFDLIHLDTSDHRDINTLGAFDFWNFYLAVKHYLSLIWSIITRWPSIVYMPIGQTTISYFRDAPFILVAKVFRRKVICHLRGGNFKNWYNSINYMSKYLVRHIHSLVDAQIVLGENLKYLFMGILPANKIFVVPNGGDFCFYTEKNRDKNTPKILFLANFIRTKGILETLYSVKEVFPYFPHAEFIFAGSWRDEKTKNIFISFCKENPDFQIVVKGPVYGKEKFDLLNSSHIFVLPTYYPNEGHPWVIIEAMAAGLPIITTDQGAISESVVNGVNGFIVEKKNSDQIAEKVKYLLEHPDECARMGLASRDMYFKNFTEEKMAAKMSQCFHSVITNSQ